MIHGANFCFQLHENNSKKVAKYSVALEIVSLSKYCAELVANSSLLTQAELFDHSYLVCCWDSLTIFLPLCKKTAHFEYFGNIHTFLRLLCTVAVSTPSCKLTGPSSNPRQLVCISPY